MTQNEHTLIAGIIIFVGWQLVWHLVLKHHPVTKKNIQELLDIFKGFL
jgi:hypothetical protein